MREALPRRRPAPSFSAASAAWFAHRAVLDPGSPESGPCCYPVGEMRWQRDSCWCQGARHTVGFVMRPLASRPRSDQPTGGRWVRTCSAPPPTRPFPTPLRAWRLFPSVLKTTHQARAPAQTRNGPAGGSDGLDLALRLVCEARTHEAAEATEAEQVGLSEVGSGACSPSLARRWGGGLGRVV